MVCCSIRLGARAGNKVGHGGSLVGRGRLEPQPAAVPVPQRVGRHGTGVVDVLYAPGVGATARLADVGAGRRAGKSAHRGVGKILREAQFGEHGAHRVGVGSARKGHRRRRRCHWIKWSTVGRWWRWRGRDRRYGVKRTVARDGRHRQEGAGGSFFAVLVNDPRDHGGQDGGQRDAAGDPPRHSRSCAGAGATTGGATTTGAPASTVTSGVVVVSAIRYGFLFPPFCWSVCFFSFLFSSLVFLKKKAEGAPVSKPGSDREGERRTGRRLWCLCARAHKDLWFSLWTADFTHPRRHPDSAPVVHQAVFSFF
ncbi:hypothetical protein TW95_gp1211 [Pandoravirus inopinatum]|uniref:Uncharacterized protein n=1 Tax=Pandoravirus inopinatum TaxID=1605721 RepID=A0A0B5J7R0_9VIRU|nr:hypothetical protein TW95_gp1211 [Pandoravirus inopinatum]AJF97945.1 hypothetical protein [Pandoravirus inopinatum]